MARPATHHQATRDRLLDLATEAVVERGAHNLQVADVAAAAGLTAPAVYRYFRDRDDLLVAALRRQVAEFAREVASREDLGTFFEDQQAYLSRADRGAVRFVLECVLASGDDPALASEVAPAVEAYRARHGSAAGEGTTRAALVTAVCAGVQFLFAAGLLAGEPGGVYRALLDLLEGEEA